MAAICFALLFIGGPDFYSSRSFKTAWGLGHIVAFAVFTYLLAAYWPKLKSMAFISQGIYLLGAAVVIGALTEVVQSFFGRTPLLRDLLRDIEGAAVGIAFLLPARKMIPKIKRRTFQAVILGVIIFESYPLAIVLADEIIARQQFPILADFETPFEISRTGSDAVGRTDQIARNGKHSLAVPLTTEPYSGIGLKYLPGNWSGYTWLHFSIYNPDEDPLKITCRVNDRQHVKGEQHYQDRFNRSFMLKTGWNDINIPLTDIENAPDGRRMNMKQIQSVGFFATNLPAPRMVYLDYVHLENR